MLCVFDLVVRCPSDDVSEAGQELQQVAHRIRFGLRPKLIDDAPRQPVERFLRYRWTSWCLQRVRQKGFFLCFRSGNTLSQEILSFFRAQFFNQLECGVNRWWHPELKLGAEAFAASTCAGEPAFKSW